MTQVRPIHRKPPNPFDDPKLHRPIASLCIPWPFVLDIVSRNNRGEKQDVYKNNPILASQSSQSPGDREDKRHEKVPNDPGHNIPAGGGSGNDGDKNGGEIPGASGGEEKNNNDEPSTKSNPLEEAAKEVKSQLELLGDKSEAFWETAISAVQKTLETLDAKSQENLDAAATDVLNTLKAGAAKSKAFWETAISAVQKTLETLDAKSQENLDATRAEVQKTLEAGAAKSKDSWETAISAVQKTLETLDAKSQENLDATRAEVQKTLEVQADNNMRKKRESPARFDFDNNLRLLKSARWLNQHVEGGFRARDAIRSVIGHKSWEKVTPEDIETLRYKFPSLFESFKEEKSSEPAAVQSTSPLDPLSPMYGLLYMQAFTMVGLTAVMVGMSFLSWMPLFFMPHLLFPVFFLA